MNETIYNIIENYSYIQTKWEKYFIASLLLGNIIYSIYLYRIGDILPFTNLIILIPILSTNAFMQYKTKHPSVLYKVQLKDGYLSVYNHSAKAILWKKRLRDIVEVIITKNEYFYKMRTKEKMLIIKTINDSYSFPLNSVKVAECSNNEFVNLLQQEIKKHK